jgi:hypothetical protein
VEAGESFGSRSDQVIWGKEKGFYSLASGGRGFCGRENFSDSGWKKKQSNDKGRGENTNIVNNQNPKQQSQQASVVLFLFTGCRQLLVKRTSQ